VEEGEGEGRLGPNYKTVWEEREALLALDLVVGVEVVGVLRLVLVVLSCARKC
jgi:hypothetical protein